MLAVDTNVLVYCADRGCAEHGKCRALIEQLRMQPSAWYVTWHIIYEFIRIVTHFRVLRKPWSAAQAWEFARVLLASPSLGLLVETERHAEVVARTIGEIPNLRGNLVHDARTAILMREHGIRRIYTRDTDFHRFPFLEVIDPLTAV